MARCCGLQVWLGVFILPHLGGSNSTLPSLPTARPSPREWGLLEYPNPMKDPASCGRDPDEGSHVCDPDRILTSDEADELEQVISATCDDTPCECDGACSSECRGYSLAVAIVDRMKMPHGGRDRASMRTEVRRLAQWLRVSAWDYGACDNDLVIAVSRHDQAMYTSTGARTKQVLSDSCVKTIASNTKPYFTTCQYYLGLLEMIKQYRDSLTNGTCVTYPPPHNATDVHRCFLHYQDNHETSSRIVITFDQTSSTGKTSKSLTKFKDNSVLYINIGIVLAFVFLGSGVVYLCCCSTDRRPSPKPWTPAEGPKKTVGRWGKRFKPGAAIYTSASSSEGHLGFACTSHEFDNEGGGYSGGWDVDGCSSFGSGAGGGGGSGDE